MLVKRGHPKKKSPRLPQVSPATLVVIYSQNSSDCTPAQLSSYQAKPPLYSARRFGSGDKTTRHINQANTSATKRPQVANPNAVEANVYLEVLRASKTSKTSKTINVINHHSPTLSGQAMVRMDPDDLKWLLTKISQHHLGLSNQDSRL